MADPVLFIFAVVCLLATPGPTNTLLATSGALIGWRRSLPLLAGELGGYLIAVTAIHLALAPVLAISPALGIALKLGVAAYLAFVAVKLWQRGTGPAGDRPVTTGGVFVVTLFNPKALVFALGIIPFNTQPLWAYALAFCVSISLVGCGWIFAGALVGRAATGTRLVPRTAAGVLALFAGLVVASIFH